jgi:hypothetical protein
MERAIAREKPWKNWRRDWKIALIEGVNPDWHDLAPGLGFAPLWTCAQRSDGCRIRSGMTCSSGIEDRAAFQGGGRGRRPGQSMGDEGYRPCGFGPEGPKACEGGYLPPQAFGQIKQM